MPGSRLPQKLAALLLLLPLGACVQPDHEELRGSLYFAVGNYLAQLDLRDGSTYVVANLGDAEIRTLSPQLDERLLLTVYGSENNRETHRLVLYDIDTRQTLTLSNGHVGHYLPGTEVLVFDDGVRLYVTERVDGSWIKTEVVAHRYNESVGILPISSTRFVYRVGNGPMFAYDRLAGESVELAGFDSACRFDRMLWFAPDERMLCQVRGAGETFEYRFVSLDGVLGERLPLPVEHDFRPLAYLPDQDVLVLTERWRGRFANRVKWGVWIYRFDTRETYRLLDDQYLGDTVSYARD